MTPPGLYTIAQVAAATGMNLRAMRHLVDMDRLPYSQWERNAERYLTNEALARLESFGIRVNRELLNAATAATAAHASSEPSSTEDSENES